ncbi:hypothetical protein [Lepagella muris]|uniref:Uncharacterized protein n=1 Tax=Lepagella muris TaxID=3032870 RepID=A0AC61RJC7_9BACT|nr:hypothetical protein [Lepagella muris]TGY79969.1 hypothetical protein E5331_04055 [Lepagella muris]THG53207.1 hypothetical protein E5984_03825 [Bacteroidales bacterium]TKC64908.1 hypothetical protein E5359_001980 [Bacteroidales bacterium]
MAEQETEQELTREQRLEIEDKAINALLSMGAKFSVPLKINPVKPSKWFNLKKRIFRKRNKVWRDKRIPKDWDVKITEVPDVDLGRTKEVYMRHFYIKPLYLGTIDCLRKLYIAIEYDEEAIQNQPLQESKRLFKYIDQMAVIAAVAVLNNPCVTDPNDKSVKELAEFFIEHLTVARLQKLAEVINQMMNTAGFTSSIRLIREMGTTRPKPQEQRIE